MKLSPEEREKIYQEEKAKKDTENTAKYKKQSWGCAIVVLVIGLIFISMVARSCSKPTQTTKPSQTTAPVDYSMIRTRVEIQDMTNEKGERKVVTWVSNDGNKTFTGSVSVRSIDVDGKSLGSDVVYPENLEPGKSTYGISWLKVSRTAPKAETKVMGGSFK